jgi:hypothetical protein
MRDPVVSAFVTLDDVMRAPGGPVEIGSFAFEEPNGGGLERRERLVSS